MAFPTFFELESLASRDPQTYEILKKVVEELRKQQQYTLTGEGSPEGVIAARVGTHFIQRDLTQGHMQAEWVKTGGGAGATGWVPIHSISTLSGGTGYLVNGAALPMANGETPAGVIDGVNKIFTLARAPSPAASLKLFVNGLLRTDYTLVGATATFATAPPLLAVIRSWYTFAIPS